MRDGFVFYRSFAEALNALPKAEKEKALDFIINYALDDLEPEEAEGVAVAVFKLVKPQIDANNKRFENGCKGGAPLGNQNARKQPKTTENNQKQPKEKVKDKVKDKDKYITPKIHKWAGTQNTYDFEKLTEEIKAH